MEGIVGEWRGVEGVGAWIVCGDAAVVRGLGGRRLEVDAPDLGMFYRTTMKKNK